MREFRAGDRCVALASIGSGDEIARVIDQLSHQQALFVFESDRTALRAVLSRLDFSAAIRDGRLRFLSNDSPERALRECLIVWPGLPGPQVLLAMPAVPAARTEAARAAIETVGREVESLRMARIVELSRDFEAYGVSAAARDRAAFLSLAPDPATHAACRLLGGHAASFIVDRPDASHPVAAAEFLHRARPRLVVWSGHSPPPAVPSSATFARWHTSCARLPDALDSGGIHLAASPVVMDELRTINPNARVEPFYWPAPVIDCSNQRADDAVYLVADLPDDSPEACGIRQATHRTLWQTMQRIAAEIWADGAFQHAGHLLATAERAAGLRITEETIRRQLLKIVRHVLIPTCGLRKIRQSVERNHTRLKLVGRGWRDPRAGSTVIVADDRSSLGTMASNIRPAAAVFTLAGDPFSPALLTALVAGWPVVLHAPRGLAGLAGIGADHVLSFGDEAGLRRCLESTGNVDPTRRRAELAREYVQTTHSAGRRHDELRKRLSG